MSFFRDATPPEREAGFACAQLGCDRRAARFCVWWVRHLGREQRIDVPVCRVHYPELRAAADEGL